MPRPRLLLADDNALVAAQIKDLLSPWYDVVGVVSSGEELEAAFEALSPQVIVTDIAMPGGGGLTAVKRIRERHPGTPVVLLTVLDQPPMVRLGLSVGAQGYVVKQDAGEELVEAVRAALEGRQYISSSGRCELH